MTDLFTNVPVRRMWSGVVTCLALAAFAGPGRAQDLPEGPGKDVTVKICGACHDASTVATQSHDRNGWSSTIDDMVGRGAQGSDAEFTAILDYLVKNFPLNPPLNVNKAAAAELESKLALSHAEAAAIVQFRAEKGDFKSLAELEKVPGVDVKKIEAKKDAITF